MRRSGVIAGIWALGAACSARAALVADAVGAWRGMTTLADGYEPASWRVRDVALAAAAGAALSYAAWTIGLWLAEGRIGAAWLPSYKLIAVSASFGAAIWHFCFRRRGGNLRMAGFRRPVDGWRFALLRIPRGYFYMLGILVVVYLIADALGFESESDDREFSTGLAGLIRIGLTVTLTPFWEEIVDRGILLPALLRVMPVALAMTVCSAIFAAAHFDIDGFATYFGLGFLFCWLYIRSGSIWPCVAAHAAQNAVAICLRLFAL